MKDVIEINEGQYLATSEEGADAYHKETGKQIPIQKKPTVAGNEYMNQLLKESPQHAYPSDKYFGENAAVRDYNNGIRGLYKRDGGVLPTNPDSSSYAYEEAYNVQMLVLINKDKS